MPKLVLLVEYDGSRYHGFQFQTNAPTIQAELERALDSVTGERIRIKAASRTDAGVHARGQVVSFITRSPLPPQVFVKALNFYLPPDIVVKRAFPVAKDFDVRRGAVSREYCYFIHNSPTPSPLKSRFSHFIPHPLDVEAMSQACQLLIGEKDFTSFTPSGEVRRPVRRVYRAEIRRKGELLAFSMEANSFLPHQVRHTVGALAQVGRGRIRVEEFAHLVEARSRGLAGPALPPEGLFLMKVHYSQPLEVA